MGLREIGLLMNWTDIVQGREWLPVLVNAEIELRAP
jgi:hypothetical protein